MKRALVILSAAFVLTGTGLAASAIQPALFLKSVNPPVVAGTHFRGGERVTVTFRAGSATSVKRVRASASGQFVANASDTAVADRCGDLLLVLAVGKSGDRASTKRMLPDCPPAP